MKRVSWLKAGHSNTIFSVRDIVSGTDGAVLQSYDYRENGEKTASTSLKSDKTWVGGLSVNDDTGDSGLYLMGHRHYDASLGRFLSRDPIGFAGGLNLYEYASNSPVTKVDPEGLWDWPDPYVAFGSFLKGVGDGLEYVGYVEMGIGVSTMTAGPSAGPGVLIAEGTGALTTLSGGAHWAEGKILQGLGKILMEQGDCPDGLVDLWAPGAPPNGTPKANFLDHAKRKGPEFGLASDDLVGFGNKAKELLESLKGQLKPIRNNNPRNPGGRKSASRVVGEFYEYIQTTKNNLIITIGKNSRK